jgi:hypothetical protein
MDFRVAGVQASCCWVNLAFAGRGCWALSEDAKLLLQSWLLFFKTGCSSSKLSAFLQS